MQNQHPISPAHALTGTASDRRLTLAQAARHCGLGKRVLRRLCWESKIEHLQIEVGNQKRIYIWQSKLDAFIESVTYDKVDERVL